MRTPRTSARSHRAAALAVVALLHVTTLLGVAQATSSTATDTLLASSRQPPVAPAAERSAAGRGHGDDDDRDDSDDGNKDRRDDGGERVDDVVPSVGQLIFDDGTCSATVVASDSEQLALTAAHCVYTPEHSDEFLLAKDAKPGWAEDVKFTPGRDGDEAPYGTWRVERMWVDQRWQDTGKRRYDIAVVRIAKRDGKTIEDVVGAQRIDFRVTDRDDVAVLGYPGEKPFDGTTQRECVADEIEPKDDIYVMPCRLNGGSSGGPWLAEFNQEKATGRIVAVTSFLDADKNQLGGIAPQEFVRDLIDAGERNDPRNSEGA